MKLGLILPIGNLKQFGYHHHFLTILDRWVSVADHLYIISSTEEKIEELLHKYGNVTYICDKESCFERINNKELFSFDKLNNNVNRCLDLAKLEGCDAVVQIHINQYLPNDNEINFKTNIEKMVNANKPYEWLYKSYQLRDILFMPDRRVPWIINLKSEEKFRFSCDSICDSKGTKITIKTGNFEDFSSQSIVDVLLDTTSEEAGYKHEVMLEELEKLSNIVSADKKYDEEKYLEYMSTKCKTKIFSRKKLDAVGKKISEENNVGFLSNKIKDVIVNRKSLYNFILRWHFRLFR